jgi:hypothetical protein
MENGYLMSLETCWDLAQRWYAGRMERDWQRPEAEAIQRLFDSLSLTGDFWDLTG